MATGGGGTDPVVGRYCRVRRWHRGVFRLVGGGFAAAAGHARARGPTIRYRRLDRTTGRPARHPACPGRGRGGRNPAIEGTPPRADRRMGRRPHADSGPPRSCRARHGCRGLDLPAADKHSRQEQGRAPGRSCRRGWRRHGEASAIRGRSRAGPVRRRIAPPLGHGQFPARGGALRPLPARGGDGRPARPCRDTAGGRSAAERHDGGQRMRGHRIDGPPLPRGPLRGPAYRASIRAYDPTLYRPPRNLTYRGV